MKSSAPVAQSGNGSLNVSINLPSGYHLTEGANSRFECSAVGGSSNGGLDFVPVKGPLRERETGNGGVGAQVQFDASKSDVRALRVLSTVYFCQDKSVCLFQEVVFEVELAKAEVDAAVSIDLGYTLSAKAPQVNLPSL